MIPFLTFLRRAFIIVTAGLAVYLMMAVLLAVPFVSAKPATCTQKQTLYLRHSPVHVDVVFPANALLPETKDLIALPISPAFGAPRYYVFGLGDRDIFIHTPYWKDLKLRYALKAIFLPTARTMHVEPAYNVYTNWIALEVCEDQLRDMEAYIMDGFNLDAQGNVIELDGMSYSGLDRFYEAKGSYHMFNSCNNWANGALKAGGLKAPIWAPFAQGIVHHAKRQ